jgi:metal-dependent amidase/aminoacylase/carboxypeptidase family protein
MPIVNRVADLQPDIQAWRRDIHQHPELLYDVHRTAAFVADRLREFGCDEVATGLGRTGVVGVIKGRKPAGKGDLKVIGLRADMDALPIEEDTNLDYASRTPGLMHGNAEFRRRCGGDLSARGRGRRGSRCDDQGRADGPLRHRPGLWHA